MKIVELMVEGLWNNKTFVTSLTYPGQGDEYSATRQKFSGLVLIINICWSTEPINKLFLVGRVLVVTSDITNDITNPGNLQPEVVGNNIFISQRPYVFDCVAVSIVLMTSRSDY